MKESGYRFRIIPSHVPENASTRLSPKKFVNHLALKKALHIAQRFPHDVILGADTIVYWKGKIIGKPRHPKHAEEILNDLSGAWQKVYTGVAVVWKGGDKRLVRAAVTSVKFRLLKDNEIRRAASKHLDKAGAYSVQEEDDPFVERINGDFDNVVGLPMRVVNALLRRARQHLLKTVGHNVDFKV
jgi:septum formation protein